MKKTVGKFFATVLTGLSLALFAGCALSELFSFGLGGSIVYELAGGINHESNVTAYSGAEEITLYEPSRVGYTFGGWMFEGEKVDKIGKGEKGDITLTATWSAIEYSVTYDLAGGTLVENGKDSYTIESELYLPIPVKEHYSFMGWNADGKTLFKIEKGSTGDVSFTASWVPAVYEIVYELDGGANDKKNPVGYTFQSATIELFEPVKKGYEFAGWTENGEPVSEISAGSYGKRTLTANWNAITYTLNYDLDGGINADENPETYTIESEFSLSDPVKEGYNFKEWQLNGKKVAQIEKGASGDLTLVAIWEKKPSVAFYNYDGTLLKEIFCEAGDTVVYNGDTPVREEDKYAETYEFKDWVTEQGGNVPATLTGIASAVSVYARYTAKNVKIENLTDFTVTIPTGRDVRILQISDTQIVNPAAQRYSGRHPTNWQLTDSNLYDTCYRYIDYAVSETDPDLILLAGDIVYGEFDDDGSMLLNLVSYMESLGIPWAPVFGNHDNESQMGVTWQCEQFESATNCIFKRGEVTGNGNYTIGISQGGKLVKVIYMMDSNGCTGAYSYKDGDGVVHEINQEEAGNVKTTAGFGSDQIDWLRENAELVSELLGNSVSNFITFHIPIAEFEKAAYASGYQSTPNIGNGELYKIGETVPAKNGDFGTKGEVFKGAHEEKGLWEILKANNFDGVFCAHSHKNNVSMLYDGIRLTFGLKTGTHDRYTQGELGGTAITLHSDGTFTVEHKYYELDYTGVDYTFSEANEADVTTAHAWQSAEIDGMVVDATATDGYALKASKLDHPGGVELRFDNIDVSQYDYVSLRARVEGTENFFVYVNGTSTYVGALYKNAAYATLNLKVDRITSLTSVVIKSDSKILCTIYVDYVRFANVDYSFSSADDPDLDCVTVLDTAKDACNGIVATDGATDGYALHLSHFAGSNWSQIRIAMNKDFSQYSSIVVRMKGTTDSQWCLYGYTDKNESKSFTATQNVKFGNGWVEWDLLATFTDAYVAETDGTNMLYIKIQSSKTTASELYIDSITFVEKA